MPRVVHGVGQDLLFVWFDRDAEFDRLCIYLPKRRGFLRYCPVERATEMLHNADFHRVLLMIAQSDFEGFVNPGL